MAADINEILSKEALDSIKELDKLLINADGSITKIIATSKQLDSTLKNISGAKEFNAVMKDMAANQTTLARVTKQRVAADKESEKADKKSIELAAKLAQKEKEHLEILQKTVTTRGEAKKQIKALNIEIDKATSAHGKQSKEVKELTRRIDENTKFIRTNSSAAGKQAMNVGNYSSVWSGLKGILGGVGAALGITGGLIAGMKAIISATDAASDNFYRTLSGLKEQTNYFARAVANLDFTNFIEGMKAARQEGERYYDQLDLIGNIQRGLGLQQQDIDAEITRQKIIAKNKQNELSVREAAVNEIVRLEQLKLEKTSALGNKMVDNEAKNAAFQAGIREQYKGEIEDFITNYDANLNKIKKGNELLASVSRQTTSKYTTREGITVVKKDENAALILKSRMNAADREAIRYAQLDSQLTDDKREKLAQAYSFQKAATQDQLSGTESLSKLRNTLYTELIKEGKEQERNAKAAEKMPTEYEKAVKKVTDLQEKMQQFKIDNPFMDFPTEMATAFTNAKAKVFVIEEAINDLTKTTTEFKMEWKAMYDDLDTEEVKSLKDEFAELSDEIFKTAEALTTDEWETSKKQFEDEKERIKEWKDAKIEAARIVADTVFQIAGQNTEAEYDDKIRAIEKERDAKLKGATLTEKQKEKIQADADKKIAKLKKEQFRKEKHAQAIQAGIYAIIDVLKAGGLTNPAGILAAISGAAQVALIEAAPIPEFDKGTLSTPSNFIAGEKRPEWMWMPSGQWRFVDRPTMFKNLRGATVVSGEQTERLRKAGIRPDGIDLRPELNKLREDVVSSIRNKRELTISATGSKITEREGSYNKEYFNRHIKWAGKN